MIQGGDCLLFVFFIVVTYLLLMVFVVKNKWKRPFTTGSLVPLLFSIIANISLSQNYTESLIKGANDGMAISNKLAYWIITDDGWGRNWTTGLFKSFYEISTMISILLLVFFCISLIMESKIRK